MLNTDRASRLPTAECSVGSEFSAPSSGKSATTECGDGMRRACSIAGRDELRRMARQELGLPVVPPAVRLRRVDQALLRHVRAPLHDVARRLCRASRIGAMIRSPSSIGPV